VATLPGTPDCCWTATAPHTNYPPLSGSGGADVGVIGAGIVGLTAASLLFVVLIVCAVWYTRGSWTVHGSRNPAGNCDARLRRRTGSHEAEAMNSPIL
jgi:hypothetical protein